MLPLSGLDAFFLYAETESMHQHVVLVAILDPHEAPEPLTFDRFRGLVAQRLHLVPPFTRRLEPAPLGLDHPVWVPAEHVDLSHHLHQATLPAPGGPEDLGRMCGTIASRQLDRHRPLWELWLVDGLYDGNEALVAKIHHACIDGVSGAELITAFFDLDREARMPLVSDPASPAPASSPRPDPRPGDPEDGPDTEADRLVAAVAARADSLRHLVPLLRRTAAGMVEVRRRRHHGEAGGTPLTAPRLSFNRPLTPARNCAFAHVPLDETRAIGQATGCTLNDVVLAVCAGALRRYLLAHHQLPEVPLVASCPVSTRAGDGPPDHPTGNQVSVLMTRLHTQVADPLERLHAIRRSTRAAKAEHRTLGPSVLAEWSEAADPTLLRLGTLGFLRSGLADRLPPVHNLTISNVPGPPFPVYLGGTALVRAYPMGPVIEGAGCNITVMSYCDSIDVGFMVCDDAMEDVWDLADAVAPAFAELRDAVIPDPPVGPPFPAPPATTGPARN